MDFATVSDVGIPCEKKTIVIYLYEIIDLFSFNVEIQLAASTIIVKIFFIRFGRSSD